MTIIEDFIALFDGNHAALGVEDGGCWHIKPPDSWDKGITDHLNIGGDDAIGVYPLTCFGHQLDAPEWRVHWGCVDFDGHRDGDCWTHARNVQKVLEKVGVTAWVERTRSGEGYHVWVFAPRGEWVPAATVRRGLLVACEIAGAPTKEINPKSEGFDDPTTLGNYVRLPYPGWGSVANRETIDTFKRVIVDETGVAIFHLHDWVAEAHAKAGLDGLSTLADLWKPPITHVPAEMRDEEIPEELEPLIKKMSPLAHHVFVEGPLPDADRSGTLFKLAVKLYEDGQHTYSEIVALLMDSDRRWGKYWKRNDTEKRITDIVEKVWH